MPLTHKMLKFSIYAYLLFNAINLCVCAPATGASTINFTNGTLVQNYAILVRDVKWFLQSVDNFVTVVDGILPNVPTVQQQNSTSLSASTRMHMLKGLKHLLAGVREISITVQQTFDATHVRQLQQLKQVEVYVLQGVTVLKDWFANLRVLLSDLARLYGYYAPEMLLGKCVIQYLVDEYPDNSYYEYPRLFFNDIVDWATTKLSETSNSNITSIHANATGDLHVERNEIPNEERDATYHKTRYANDVGTALAINQFKTDASQKTKFWQKCFGLYTTETIMRQVKLYFEEP